MSRTRNIVWIRPAKTRLPVTELKRRDNFFLSLEGNIFDINANLTALNSLLALDLVGLPGILEASPEEELRELLIAAAEIEHGLMAQYLYAGNSCLDNLIGGVIRQIAIEEMGHLITVQNMLLAAGGNPSIGRYDNSPNEFDPFPFHLEPATRQTIAKYAACEMPDQADVDEEDREILKSIIPDATISAGNMTPYRVGLLYMKIYWLLRESDEPLPNPDEEEWENYPVEKVAALFPGRHVDKYPVSSTPDLQGKEDDWQSGNEATIVSTITSRRDARIAVAKIAAQGEGFADEFNAHFDRFVDVYKAVKDTAIIARSFATDPWYARIGFPNGKAEAEITSPIALDFAKLGDWLYEILLIAITLSLHPDAMYNQAKRIVVAAFCITLMREVIKPFAPVLSRLKIRDEANSPVLSLCLTLPDISDEAEQMHAQLTARLSEAINLATTLKTTAGLHISLRSAARTVQETLEARQDDVAVD